MAKGFDYFHNNDGCIFTPIFWCSLSCRYSFGSSGRSIHPLDFLEIRRKNYKVIARVMLVFGLSVALVLLGGLFVYLFRGFTLPNEWIQNARIAHPEEEITPFSIDGLITTAAALFGLAAGGIWVKEKGGFKANTGQFWQHLLRFIIGLAGILLIWKGLGDIFPRTGDLLSFSLRYLRYALIGIWITGFAPFIFICIKLAEKEI